MIPPGHPPLDRIRRLRLPYLCLNAKLKVWSNYHPAMWKLIAVYAPILGAVLIGGALTIDEFHNWYDVVTSAIIGTVMAFGGTGWSMLASGKFFQEPKINVTSS